MIQEDDLAKVMNFTVEQGLYGPKFVLRGWWRNQAETFIRERKIRELELNHAKNWPPEPLQFLVRLDFLVNLQLLMARKEDLSPIGSLPHLRALRIDALSITQVDFAVLEYLEQCYVEWHRNVAGILKCKSIRDLYLQSFGDVDCSKLSELMHLERLRLGNGSVSSLRGLEALSQVRFIGLYNQRKLTSLAPLKFLPTLTELDISGCRKIQAIETEVADLVNLESLTLDNSGEIPSLLPLACLKNLRKLHVGENTIVGDGDLSVLLDLPKLEEFRFQKRRHYTHTPEEVLELLASRNTRRRISEQTKLN